MNEHYLKTLERIADAMPGDVGRTAVYDLIEEVRRLRKLCGLAADDLNGCPDNWRHQNYAAALRKLMEALK